MVVETEEKQNRGPTPRFKDQPSFPGRSKDFKDPQTWFSSQENTNWVCGESRDREGQAISLTLKYGQAQIRPVDKKS